MLCIWLNDVNIHCTILLSKFLVLWIHILLNDLGADHRPGWLFPWVHTCLALLQFKPLECSDLRFYLSRTPGSIPFVNSHVLIYLNCWAQEEILYVYSAVSIPFMGIWYNAVYLEFCIQRTDCWGMNILVGFKVVNTNSHSDPVDFGLVWANSANKIAASDFAVWWYLPWLDKTSCYDRKWLAKLGEPRANPFSLQVIWTIFPCWHQLVEFNFFQYGL